MKFNHYIILITVSIVLAGGTAYGGGLDNIDLSFLDDTLRDMKAAYAYLREKLEPLYEEFMKQLRK